MCSNTGGNVLDVLGPFLSDIKSVLNRTATSLSTYVNSSIGEHSEIASSVIYLNLIDKRDNLMFLCNKFFKCVFFLLYQFYLPVKIYNFI